MEQKRIVPFWICILLLLLCAVNLVGDVMLLVDPVVSTLNKFSLALLVVSTILAIVYCLMGFKKSARKVFRAFSIVFAIALLFNVNVLSSMEYAVTSLGNQPAMTAPAEMPEGEAGTADAESTPTEPAAPNGQQPAPQGTAPDGQQPPEMPEGAAPNMNELNPADNQDFVQQCKTLIPTLLACIMFACVFMLAFALDLGKVKSYILIAVPIWLSLFFAIYVMQNVNSSVVSHLKNPQLTVFLTSVIYGLMIYAKYKDKAARGSK